MSSKVDDLLSNYEKVLIEPWGGNLSGQEKIWFLVFDPTEIRKVALRIGDFERITKKNNKNWIEIDLQNCFPDWMKNHEYRDAYFADPEAIQDQIEFDFKRYIVDYISQIIHQIENLEQTVVALTNVASLFGFLKLSDILNEIYHLNKGRILIFFPGEYHDNHYRFLNARDGWSYLARPITS